MNCLPASGIAARAANHGPGHGNRCWLLPFLLCLAGCGGVTAQEGHEAPQSAKRVYGVHYTVTPMPNAGRARVEMRVRQDRALLRTLTMSAPRERFTDIHADGGVEHRDGRLTWLPPAAGGTLTWTVRVRHRRNANTYDARLGPDWALFRGSDIIPPARTRTIKDARSSTVLQFALPAGWSSVTQYFGRDDRYPVTNPARRFDRPTGWMLLGELGVRIDDIAGVRVIVAGPTGQNVRRLDILALLHWTLPALTRLLPEFPSRLTVVSAHDPMWRGGLSAPQSMYLHAGLPLISENATSTLLHEALHVGMGLNAEAGADWIIEGLAEYYGLELLRRSRSISQQRFEQAMGKLAAWGADVDGLCQKRSSGPVTARAVNIFANLHDELRQLHLGPHPLDDLLRQLLAAGDDASVAGLRRIATGMQGSLPKSLNAAALPGCGTP